MLSRCRFWFTEVAEALAVNRAAGIFHDRWWWLITLVGSAAALIFWQLAPVHAAGSVLAVGWLWLGVVVWQPLIEELLFRGLIQGQFLRTPWGRRTVFGIISSANLLTSMLFVAVHWLHHSPLWAVAVLPPSLIFGWLRERHQNTWSPFVTHAVYNLAFFIGAALAAS